MSGDDAMWCPALTWPAMLAGNLHVAALEELRVRAAERRVAQRWSRELAAARRHVPIGGRR